MNTVKIVLVGYMASGKSKIGKILSEKINFPFFDLDELIEKSLSQDINEIFSERGELFFRKVEHKILSEKIKESQNFVLSLGGGTPCYFNNHELLKQENIVSIYLKANINTLSKRILLEKENRPLLKNLSDEELSDYIAKHLFDRSFYYHQCHHVIVVDNKSPEEIVIEIEKILL